ncbi:hypothetical protein PAUR_a4340 [Pseudoalteromonas aurantia 208]|uniref:Uncharacterized protein n=1 Tax=Pseudoalteromonas aurantia 208 TaxID=1314867 RepID=A0ABR9EHR7_9GAMM|nr:hypothetical protein [Pseudoalteromonas aurantia 208]
MVRASMLRASMVRSKISVVLFISSAIYSPENPLKNAMT